MVVFEKLQPKRRDVAYLARLAAYQKAFEASQALVVLQAISSKRQMLYPTNMEHQVVVVVSLKVLADSRAAAYLKSLAHMQARVFWVTSAVEERQVVAVA